MTSAELPPRGLPRAKAKFIRSCRKRWATLSKVLGFVPRADASLRDPPSMPGSHEGAPTSGAAPVPQSEVEWARHLDAPDGIWPRAETYKAYCRERAAELACVRTLGPLDPGEIACFTVVHNDLPRLHDFLRHYRSIGIDRFVIIDHRSTDGTREALLDEPDVDLYRTEASFARACGGNAWKTALARRYAKDRWALLVDVDEHLVFDRMDAHDIHDLTALLDTIGHKRLFAPMVDMYPAGPLAEAPLDNDTRLAQAYPFFDPVEADGVRFLDFATTPYGPSLRGGPRRRQLTSDGHPWDAFLPKHPLSVMDEDTLYCMVHHPFPYARNVDSPRAGLLHFKFLADFARHQDDQARLGEAWGGGAYNRQAAAEMERRPDLSFMHPAARRYEGPQSLIDAGISTALPWADAPPATAKARVVRSPRRALVLVRAGDQSLHPAWIAHRRFERRGFDLHVDYFGNLDTPFPAMPEDVTFTRRKGPKFAGIADCLDAIEEGGLRDLSAYDHVWFPDDDILADPETIDAFLAHVAHHGLDLAQPALHERSHIAHAITCRHEGSLLRFTSFVEVMCPCFSRAALELCRPAFRESRSAWGLDFLFGKLLGHPERGIGIVDATPVVHTRPFGGPNIALVRQAGIDPEAELQEVMARHGLAWDMRTFAALRLDGSLTEDQDGIAPARPF